MSGNYKTKLDTMLEQKFYESYGSKPLMPDGWFQKYVQSAVDRDDAGRMAGLIWQVYKRAFYDGFTAKLSGVQDESEP